MKKDRAGSARAQWEVELPGLGAPGLDLSGLNLLPMEVLGRLAESTQLIRKSYLDPVFAAHGLKPGEFDVLATLRRSGAPFALTPTELYNSTMISSGGMTARLDRLEAAGLIVRTPHETDRRAVQISLTESGRELIENILPQHVAAQEKAVSGVTSKELETLAVLLRKLLEGLPEGK